MRWKSNWSLRRKMMFLFSVPLILLELLVYIEVSYSFTNQYQEQLNRTLIQTQNQAVSFLSNYAANMEYMAQLVENDAMIQATAVVRNQNLNTTFLEEYNEFYQMNRAFDRMEMENGIYRLILYVPDQVFYKSNAYYFYGLSRLEDRSDYINMLADLERFGNYFSTSMEKTNKTETEYVDMITLYHAVKEDGGYGRQVGICSVSIPVQLVRHIIQDAKITETGTVFLTDQFGNLVVASDDELAQNLISGGGIFTLEKNKNLQKYKTEQGTYYISTAGVGIEGWDMVMAIPQKEYLAGLNQQIVKLAIVLCILLAMVYLISSLLARYVTGRLGTLSRNMKELEKGDLYVQLPETDSKDEIEEVYSNFNFMVDEVRRMVQEHYQLGKAVKHSELKALQAQINPHFLYNTLDLINWMAIEYDAEDIEEITQDLARFYRLSLNHGRSLISVREEVEHIRVYAAIENFHYEGAVSLECHIPEELEELACLNIIMQPFVENSIVHGMAEHPEIEHTTIRIQAERHGDEVIFIIEDDGPGMTEEMMQSITEIPDRSEIRKKGYGIRNVNFRIRLCFGEQYGVRYERPERGGTRAVIRIPALSMEEAEKIVEPEVGY